MAGWPPEKNAAFTWYFVLRDADGDPVASAAGLDVEYSIDGGAFTDVAGTEVDEGEGVYSCPITAGEMNGDVIVLICKSSTGGVKTAVQVIYTSTRQIDDLAFPATSGRSIQVETDGMIHADVKEWLATAVSALISGRVDASVGAMAANVITAAAINNAAITNAKFGLAAVSGGALSITAAEIAANAIDSSQFTQAAADKIWASAARTLTALGFNLANTDFAAGAVDANALATDAANEIRDAILDELTASHVGAGSVGEVLNNLPNDGALSALTEARMAELDPANLPTDVANVQSDTDDIQTRLPAALVGGRMDASVGAMAANVLTAAAINAAALTAAKFAAGAVDANALAADAAQKIRDEILPTQNAAFNNIMFLFVAASDHVTPVTGATGTAVTRSIDGGAFGAGTGTLAEVANGMYQYDASAADMNGGVITFRFTATGGTPGAPDDRFLTVVTGGGV